MSEVKRYADLVREQDASGRSLRSSMLLLLILTFLVAAFVWAGRTEIDEVTRGEGRVIPSQQLQELKSLEAGLVRRVLVAQGDVVEAGDLLIVLDRTESEGEMKQFRQRELALMATIARLEAEVEGGEPAMPEAAAGESVDVIASERRLFRGRRAELGLDLKILDQQRAQRQAEREDAEAELETAQLNLALTLDEVRMIEPLVRRGLEPELSLLHLRSEAADLTGRVESARFQIERIAFALAEIEDKREARLEAYRNEALEEMTEATATLAELRQAMPVSAERVARTEVRSPVRGVVNRMHVATIGGVVMAGAPLVDVVPLDDRLVVEGHVMPDDIAFLRPDLPVIVKVTAYDYARYGGLNGRITRIGADAVELPEIEAWGFPIEVEVHSRLYDAAGQPLDIVPGMVAQIEVLTGRRTVLDYLTEPVVKVRETAFREG